MIVYGIIQLSQGLVANWTHTMSALDSVADPLLTSFDIIFGCIMILLCVWLIPMAFGSMLNGVAGGHHMSAISPAIAMGMFAMSAAAKVGGAVATGGGSAAAGGAAAAAGGAAGGGGRFAGGASGGGGGGSRGGYRRAGSPNGASGGGALTAVDPPTRRS